MYKDKMICTLGHQDIPVIQKQPDFLVDLLQSNILLFGEPMCGKTNFIKLLITILHKRYRETDEQIYVLDFGGALAECEDLPLISAYFDNSNEEYVKRVFNLVDEQLKNNIAKLEGKNYPDCAENQPIHTTFFIDNVNAFLDEPRYVGYQEKLAKICRDGLSKGITLIMTASSTKGLSSYMGSFKQKIALSLPIEEYSNIFTHKVIAVGNNPGRGFANVTLRADDTKGTFPVQKPYELQLNCADDINSSKFREKISECFKGGSVKKYKRFPSVLTEEEYNRFDTQHNRENKTNNDIVVGLDYVECKPVTVTLNVECKPMLPTFNPERVIAIYGKKEFGKTNLLKRLLKPFLKQKEYNFVFLDDGRGQLSEICNTVKKQIKSGTSQTAVYINKYETKVVGKLGFESSPDGKRGKVRREETRKLSPLENLIYCIHNDYMDMNKVFYKDDSPVSMGIFGFVLYPQNNYKKNTVFVMQSKSLYIDSKQSAIFMRTVLPLMVSIAEEMNWTFIFTDVKDINADFRGSFNSMINVAFLLDSIAEFASERGQKSVFGSMDIKTLKEEYAKCELGDGFVYFVEQDMLKKVKFIKEEGMIYE